MNIGLINFPQEGLLLISQFRWNAEMPGKPAKLSMTSIGKIS
jgi:hypothetical protein